MKTTRERNKIIDKIIQDILKYVHDNSPFIVPNTHIMDDTWIGELNDEDKKEVKDNLKIILRWYLFIYFTR